MRWNAIQPQKKEPDADLHHDIYEPQKHDEKVNHNRPPSELFHLYEILETTGAGKCLP